MKMSLIIGTIVVIAGATVVAYKVGKDKVNKATKRINHLDLSYVKSWISTNDMEKYNSSYTVCLMRKNEIPEKYHTLLKFFLNMEKCAYICLYDKKNKSIIKGQLLAFESISPELANDLFIEFPFE